MARHKVNTEVGVSRGYSVGHQGCAGQTKRRGVERPCAQPFIVIRDGKQYCYYHDPRNPKKFGERKYPRA